MMKILERLKNTVSKYIISSKVQRTYFCFSKSLLTNISHKL
jgi:hypothetical protein